MATSTVFGIVSASLRLSTTPSSALILEDGGEIIDAALALPPEPVSASPSIFCAAAASTGGWTFAGNRRLNGSALAGGHGKFRLASGESVVVVVVVGGLIVEIRRRIFGMWLTASFHQLLLVVVVVVDIIVVVIIVVVGFSFDASVARKFSSQMTALVGAGVTTSASRASHPSKTDKIQTSLTTGLTHKEYRLPGSCLF